MTRWWPWMVALVVPGGSVIALGIWLRRRWLAREAAAIDQVLAAKRDALRAAQRGQTLDESLRTSAAARNLEADKKRREAAQIASGKPKPLIRAVS